MSGLSRHLQLVFCFIATFSLMTHVAQAKSHEDLPALAFVGTAYPLNQDSKPEFVLYTEHHSIVRNAEGGYVKGKVEYKNAKGELIATKELSYSEQQTLPELRFDDLRTSNVFETINKLEGKKGSVKLTSQEGSVLNTNKVDMDSPSRSVVDAGFDLFVIKHWDSLLKGKKVKLDFLALTRASFYGFYLQKEKTFEDRVVMSLEPSSFFLSLLMEPITLTYDINTKRILRFEGLTNIEEVIDGKAKGQNHVARIEYEYLE